MRWILSSLVLLIAPVTHGEGSGLRERTFSMDIVALIDLDQKIEGRAELAAQSGRYTYWFAEESTKAAFLKNPGRYEIQLGGSCARMGPLSGEGTPRLFAVHDHKLYIFASEQCRASFVAKPDQFLEADDPTPPSTEESRQRGRRLLGKAVDAIGCRASIDAVTTYREAFSREQESRGKIYRVTRTVMLAWPDKVRSETCWNDSCWGSLADETRGWLLHGSGADPMDASQRAAFWRSDGRHVLTLLRARDAADIICSATGEKRTLAVPAEGEVEVELLTVHRAGATTVLGLDATGRVRLMACRGRGPDHSIGGIERIFSRFHAVNGLMLPGRVDVAFNGSAVPELSGEYSEQAVDDPNDRATFDRPPAAPDSPPS